jgi:alginate O-acetyltransferase complex protein AlgI
VLFNSIDFAVFLPIVFILYWFIAYKNLKIQNIVLLTASYIFYGWWDWRFLILLFLLSVINYIIGIGIENKNPGKKANVWFVAGLIINIGVLAVFKYYNFFIDSFIDLVSVFGYDLPKAATRIVVPLGISFYIFLSLSYLIDIYKKNFQANRNIIEVLLSLGFFPIILAGPIQRPSSLIPQIAEKRTFNYNQAVEGLRQILWGLFTKVVIADNLAAFVDNFFGNYQNYSGSVLLLGALFYSVQIYADFSGYSNIAIGTAKLFGFNLMRNFAYPYFSRDISEFWKRWHMSLTSWFRDYVFLPLSFTVSWKIKGEKVLFIRTDHFIYIVASTITWFLTGLWHGANYTFVIWGMIHGILLILYYLQRNPRKKLLKKIGITNDHFVLRFFETLITLFFVLLAWIFFRSDSVANAVNYISIIFSPSLFSLPHFAEAGKAIITIVFTILLLVIEWFCRDQQFALASLGLKWKRPFRYAIYFGLIITILLLGGKGQQFIYFQF